MHTAGSSLEKLTTIFYVYQNKEKQNEFIFTYKEERTYLQSKTILLHHSGLNKKKNKR